jgi:hypothetical protein
VHGGCPFAFFIIPSSSHHHPLIIHSSSHGYDSSFKSTFHLPSLTQEHLFVSWPVSGEQDADKKRLLAQARKLNDLYPGGLKVCSLLVFYSAVISISIRLFQSSQFAHCNSNDWMILDIHTQS